MSGIVTGDLGGLTPQAGGGWVSGASISAPLPEFNPAHLVAEVVDLLQARGINVLVDLGSANTAVTAAADLLRALGVNPASAPRAR